MRFALCIFEKKRKERFVCSRWLRLFQEYVLSYISLCPCLNTNGQKPTFNSLTTHVKYCLIMQKNVQIVPFSNVFLENMHPYFPSVGAFVDRLAHSFFSCHATAVSSLISAKSTSYFSLSSAVYLNNFLATATNLLAAFGPLITHI